MVSVIRYNCVDLELVISLAIGFALKSNRGLYVCI